MYSSFVAVDPCCLTLPCDLGCYAVYHGTMHDEQVSKRNQFGLWKSGERELSGETWNDRLGLIYLQGAKRKTTKLCTSETL